MCSIFHDPTCLYKNPTIPPTITSSISPNFPIPISLPDVFTKPLTDSFNTPSITHFFFFFLLPHAIISTISMKSPFSYISHSANSDCIKNRMSGSCYCFNFSLLPQSMDKVNSLLFIFRKCYALIKMLVIRVSHCPLGSLLNSQLIDTS